MKMVWVWIKAICLSLMLGGGLCFGAALVVAISPEPIAIRGFLVGFLILGGLFIATTLLVSEAKKGRIRPHD